MRLNLILKIKNWCEEIIVVIILSIIIECLIPNGKNKKYIKVIIGIYTVYVTINPVLNLLNYNFNIEDSFSNYFKTEEVYADLDDIKDIYIDGIKEGLKKEIINLGYDVIFINIVFDSRYENIEKIELKIESNKNTEILKQYIFENYLVDKENIVFK